MFAFTNMVSYARFGGHQDAPAYLMENVRGTCWLPPVRAPNGGIMDKTRDNYVERIMDLVLAHACAEAHYCSVAEEDIPITLLGGAECRKKLARILDEYAKERD